MDIFSPLAAMVNWLTYDVLHLAESSVFAGALNFFIYDSAKIFILLTVIIYAVSVGRTFIPAEKIRAILSKRRTYFGNILAAMFGIITPFCSCSAVPLFLGFIESGIPLGITFSFLVASPMINEVALVMLLGMFGWKVALMYVVSGLVIATLAGIAIGKLKVEHLVEDFAANRKAATNIDQQMTWADRRAYAWQYTSDIIRKVWPYILVGIGFGAWIHGYVPADFLVRYAGSDKWYAVPLATLIGIPLYSNAAGVIPLVGALTEKGVSMGTTLAFMMAVTGLSLPEFMILKKVMKPKLILIFAGIVATGIIFTGYLFNAVL